MNFDFSDDQKFLQQECRKMLEGQSPLNRVREIFEGEEAFDKRLWASMGELGWLGAAIPECYGGSGMGQLELAVIAEEVGRSLAAVPFSSSIYLGATAILVAGSEEQKNKYLPGLASGELIACFATQEDLYTRNSTSLSTVLSGGVLRGRKKPVLDGDIADIAIVSCMEEGQLVLAIADLREDGLSRKPLKSLDHSRSQGLLEFHGLPAQRLGDAGTSKAFASHLMDRAAVLLAFEQIGGGQRCLEYAREFALQRYAFGRPVASFQAIKHKLADIYVALELARSNAYHGVWALENNSDELAIAAATARISATEAFDNAAEDALHIHGGAGFTWEYDCHLFVRRARLLSMSLGTARSWKNKLIDRVQENYES
ncbi:MAG: acyl-CoA/acyl-ACP dehydrogenase [Proteobacteria bacterium]|nr:acyl-CoA/acyl-ACP dehydrogenase [Pseudomonadota bacterium]